MTLSRFRRNAARRLRANETDAERKLRRGLDRVPLSGTHFRRQAPIGEYIVDFACHRLGIVIEVDGGQHGFASNLSADARRTAALEREGYVVLRFWNNEVMTNLDGCLEVIAQAVAARTSTSPLMGEVAPEARVGVERQAPGKRPHPSPARRADPPRRGEGEDPQRQTDA